MGKNFRLYALLYIRILLRKTSSVKQCSFAISTKKKSSYISDSRCVLPRLCLCAYTSSIYKNKQNSKKKKRLKNPDKKINLITSTVVVHIEYKIEHDFTLYELITYSSCNFV